MKNLNILPSKSYVNLELAPKQKKLIYIENKDKSGIYCLTNIINNKSYVGCSKNLKNRLGNYLSKEYLKKVLLRSNSLIAVALLEHGHANFRLDILEYCNNNILIEREQFYIYKISPEYNILKVAGSHLKNKQFIDTLK
jgi:group I intron endonuclease